MSKPLHVVHACKALVLKAFACTFVAVGSVGPLNHTVSFVVGLKSIFGKPVSYQLVAERVSLAIPRNPGRALWHGLWAWARPASTVPLRSPRLCVAGLKLRRTPTSGKTRNYACPLHLRNPRTNPNGNYGLIGQIRVMIPKQACGSTCVRGKFLRGLTLASEGASEVTLERVVVASEAQGSCFGPRSHSAKGQDWMSHTVDVGIGDRSSRVTFLVSWNELEAWAGNSYPNQARLACEDGFWQDFRTWLRHIRSKIPRTSG